MKIAQITPLYEPSPRLYGGPERVEDLVKQGHEVTLFAISDWVTSAKL